MRRTALDLCIAATLLACIACGREGVPVPGYGARLYDAPVAWSPPSIAADLDVMIDAAPVATLDEREAGRAELDATDVYVVDEDELRVRCLRDLRIGCVVLRERPDPTSRHAVYVLGTSRCHVVVEATKLVALGAVGDVDVLTRDGAWNVAARTCNAEGS